MKIISGALRGRRFAAYSAAGIKPISGRIKQSLFDILAPLVKGAKVLDLFAGTGAVGFEALSRGADYAFFVDNDRGAVRSIENNIANLDLSDHAMAFRGNALEDLSWISFRAAAPTFNIIFLGPPYRDKDNRPLALTTTALERVRQARLLFEGGLIVSQHHTRETTSPPEGLEVVRREKYGDTFLDFIRQTRKS